MGGGKKSKAPKAPDYAALAAQEGAQSKEIAGLLTQWNRPTQIDQYGNKLQWSQQYSAADKAKIDAAQKQYDYWNSYVTGQGWNPDGTDKRVRNANDIKWARGHQLKDAAAALAAAKKAPTQWQQEVILDPKVKAQQDAYMAAQSKAQQLYGQKLDQAANKNLTRGELPTYNPGELKQFNATDVQALNQGAMPDVNKFMSQLGLGSIGTLDPNSGKEVSDALYESVMGRARTEQARENEALDVKLRNQGLQPGTEAYDRAMKNLMTAHGDVATQAGYQATIGGYEEARNRYLANLQGQQSGLDRYGSMLNSRNQGVNEYLANLQGRQTNMNQYATMLQGREQGLQEYLGKLQGQGQDFAQRHSIYNQAYADAAAMAGFAGAPVQPQFQGFSGATGYNPTDLLGAANASYQAKMGGYNANQSKKGSLLGSGMQLGGSLLGGK